MKNKKGDPELGEFGDVRSFHVSLHCSATELVCLRVTIWEQISLYLGLCKSFSLS